MNITMPIGIDEEYYLNEEKGFKEINDKRKLISINDLDFINDKIPIFKGDITFLKDIDVIVNAANKKMLGCFYPLHNYIDNIIFSYAGLKIRRDLIEIMKIENNNKDEENGKCKETKGYSLPAKYVFHTVGPKIMFGKIETKDKEDLKNSYLSCLKKCEEMKLSSIAFPSISTGGFSFPISLAHKIAIDTVKDYLKNTKYIKRVVLVLFSDNDFNIYKDYLTNK